MPYNINSGYGAVVAGAVPMGSGKVFYVALAGTDTLEFLNRIFPVDTDGVPRVYTTIQTALDACISGRNDYVLVAPDDTDYDNDATLTMSKDSVHLICPAGLGSRYGCAARGATIDPNSAAHAITITGRGCEVAGFWIRGYTEKYCITASGIGVFIHHNDCAITCTTAVAGGIYNTGAGTRIENNYIFSNAGAGTWLFGVAAIGGATRTHIIGNVICVGNASTCTAGINMAYDNGYMQMGVVAENWIMEMPDAGGGVGAATLTAGIKAAAGTLCVNNRIGIATEANGVTGGTADQTFIANYEATSGGTLLT